MVEGAHRCVAASADDGGARDGRAPSAADRRHPPRRVARRHPARRRRHLPARAPTPVMAAVHRVVAPNPGPYTGPGTNTWIVEAGPVIAVIDPGPDDESHLAALNARIGGATVGVVLVTHSHPDHLPLAERLASAHHASVQRYPGLGDQEVVRVGTLNVTALHTPGHCADHLCFWLAGDRALCAGHPLPGRVRSLVTFPDGDVAASLRPLDRVSAGTRPRPLPGR